MSRIGNKAVAIPSGVTANVEGQTVKIKGPKGAMQVMLHDDVTVTMDKASVKLEPRGESKRARSMWGTSRTLVANLIAGVRQRTAGAITVAIENGGSGRPLTSYPARTESLTAGEWNRAAAANNRAGLGRSAGCGFDHRCS